MNRTRYAAVLLAVMALTSGCYTTRPLGQATPEPETRVVSRLTDAGVASMGSAIGPGAVAVEGFVARADASVWELYLLRVEHRDAGHVRWSREQVSFPREVFDQPMVKRLDRTRSWLAAGGVVVGALLAGRAFLEIVGGGDEPGTGTPPPQQQILIRVGGR